jgi:hypothetical protein
MATTFPTALDTLQNPTSTTPTNSSTLSHAAQHANANDAIEAIQSKIGIDSSTDVNSIDYKLRQKATVVSVPSTATSTGTAGQIAYNTTHLYVCVATNTWVRADLTTW